MHITSILSSTLLAVTLLLQSVVDSRPVVSKADRPHIRSRRSADLGDISAGASGILNEEHVPLKDCKDIDDLGLTTSGLYRIDPQDGNGEFTVFCDMTLLGGGWTVIQRRINDSLDFERNWDEYVHGFGNFNENFWLGLDKIKRITDMGTYEIYIGLENFYTTGTKTAWAKYASFCLGSAASNYPLTLGTYDSASTARNSLGTHSGEAFSTKDKDNDSHTTEHCAQTYKGGWWYKSCHDSNLNGKWYDNGVLADPNVNDGIIWDDWISNTYSLKTSVIAVRRT